MKRDAAINELCLTCEREDCNGICDELRETMGTVRENRTVQTLTWRGVTRTISEWAEIFGISRQAMYKRIKAYGNGHTAIDMSIKGTTLEKSLPKGAIEETYMRISNMHEDYLTVWCKLEKADTSAGMVVKYDAIRTSTTNKVSDPTLERALPELQMTDSDIEKRNWLACAFYIMNYYKIRYPKDHTNERILGYRIIEGYSMVRIAKIIDEEDTKHKANLDRVRRRMNIIVRDIATEAFKRGLLRDRT